jgi:hypothetical protein
MLQFPLQALATLAAGLTLHELGHAIAGLLTRGHITEFVLFSLTPHVQIAGTCSPAGEALRTAAGSGLVLLLYFSSAIVQGRASDRWQVVRNVSFWFAMIEILGWFLCSLFPGSNGPNDATRFVEVSGISPAAVAAVCALIACAATIHLLWRDPARATQPDV